MRLQLVSAGKGKDHLAEALALKLHQEFDGIPPCTAGEAVIKLLSGRHRHRRLAVVVKRTDAHEFAALFLEHDVLADHINDVRPFLDGVDRSGMEPGGDHGSILGSRRMPSNNPEQKTRHG